DCAYMIEGGKIEISRKSEELDKILALAGRGAIIGEMALIDDKPRTATARCVEQTTVMVVTREMFKKRIEHLDPITRHLLHKFVSIIRDQAAQLADARPK
ncbi:MAG: cyclic nucleotide-binding domain-containing protein, partial [Alphaproteobacteria bacterium]|nr:cyclic nucleotide-binding domain-containing protein [Alphaproteobacteria bacterium]